MANLTSVKAYHFLRNELYSILSNDIEKLQSSIVEGFDDLSSYAYDVNSVANPIDYRDTFINNLSNFSYFELINNGFTLCLPNLNTFDFSGIEFLVNILVGTMGEYYEIPFNTAIEIGETGVLSRTPISTMSEELYFLIEKSKKVKELTDSSLTVFPFSNMPPLEQIVFGPVAKFKENNKDRIHKIVKSTINNIRKKI